MPDGKLTVGVKTKQRFYNGGKTMRTTSLVCITSAIMGLILLGCVGRPMDGSMRGMDHMMGYGGYGGIYMWLFLIVVAAVIIYFAVGRRRGAGGLQGSANESATEILKKRYARGEITKEEFDRLKNEIER